jgi:hypothetical protein
MIAPATRSARFLWENLSFAHSLEGLFADLKFGTVKIAERTVSPA